MDRLHIVDGYGYIYRAYYGLAGPGVRLTRSDGMPTGALYVYAQMLVRLHLDVKPERMVVVFDAPGKTFRNELDAEYKATRKETPDDLKLQLPLFRPLTEAFSWPVVAVPGVEADDTIATLVTQARAKDWDVTIFSADKDLMQLVDDRVSVIDSMRQKTYDRDAVVDKFGVGPEAVADWLALVGDSSDNVPGMAGVGKKTAAKLLGQYGTIDGIVEHTSELKGKMKERFEDPAQLERLELSRQLVALKRDVEVGVEIENLVPAPWDGEKLKQTFFDLEFNALVERLDPAAAPPPPKKKIREDVELPEPVVAGSWDEVAELASAAKESGRVGVSVFGDGDRLDRERVIGFALAVPDRPAIYVPIAHRYLSAPPQLAVDSAPELVRQILAGEGVEVLCHESKSARRVLGRVGLRLGEVAVDTMLAGYLIDASSDAHAIADIAKRLLGATLPTRKELLGTGKKALAAESADVDGAARLVGLQAAATVAAAPLLR
ncbi:MAG: hypothetical protein KJO07_04120, partial [Deltaproteobacteria bacterium]|nr:hypothetical protein [Deltaproteobacteria bacterium]